MVHGCTIEQKCTNTNDKSHAYIAISMPIKTTVTLGSSCEVRNPKIQIVQQTNISGDSCWSREILDTCDQYPFLVESIKKLDE